MNPKVLQAIALVSYFILQTLCFQYNVLGVASQSKFEHFADGAENMIFARLAWSERYGPFKDGGVLLRDQEIKGRSNNWRHYQLYVEDVPLQKPRFYKSRPALQTLLFGLFDGISPFDDVRNVDIFYWSVALISAACLSCFLYWILLEFSWLPFLFSACGLLCAPWLTVSGGHLFWMAGLFFLPFTVVAFLFRKGNKPPPWQLLLWPLLAFLVKSLFAGYELFTATLVMATIPVFYYALKEQWALKGFLFNFSLVSVGLLGGLLLSLGVLLMQVEQIEGNNRGGVANLKERLLVRTLGKSTNKNISSRIVAAGEASYRETMEKYWAIPLFRVPDFQKPEDEAKKEKGLPTAYWLIFGAIIGLVALLFSKTRALGGAVLISYLAPVSWFLIFKAHAFQHPFLDPIAWYLPTAILIFTLAGLMLKTLIKVY